MSARKAVRRIVFGLACPMLLTLGCGWAYNTSKVLVLTSVNVPGGTNGSTAVMFQAVAGEQIQITLTGVPTTMQPYGTLLGPSGGQTTTPGTGGANGGVNTGQTTISESGTYQLTIFDNSKKGGSVSVRVEVISGP